MAAWPADAEGYEGYNFYTYGLVEMMKTKDASRRFHVYVADPQNIPPEAGAKGVDANGNLAAWFTRTIENILYWASQQGRLGQLNMTFECYRTTTATGLGPWLAALKRAYSADNIGVIFAAQSENGDVWGPGFDQVIPIFKAGCPAADRPNWVHMYAWSTVDNQELSAFNSQLQNWR